MPEFSPGESKNAIAPMTNPTAKAFDYSAELYMGTNLALMAQAPFHLNANESKDIILPVIMPQIEGSYPVYIAVFSNDQFIEPMYQAEDVVIVTPLPSITITGFHYVYKVYTWTLGTKMIHGGSIVAVGFAFKNNESESVPGISLRCTTIGGGITKNLSPPRNQYWVVISQPMAIAPGYTQVWYAWNTGYHNNPSSASIIAEVLVNGAVVATRSQDFTISYG